MMKGIECRFVSLFTEIRRMQKAVNKYKIGEEPKGFHFWLSKTPQERLAAVEELRAALYPKNKDGSLPRLQRVCRITQLGKD